MSIFGYISNFLSKIQSWFLNFFGFGSKKKPKDADKKNEKEDKKENSKKESAKSQKKSKIFNTNSHTKFIFGRPRASKIQENDLEKTIIVNGFNFKPHFKKQIITFITPGFNSRKMDKLSANLIYGDDRLFVNAMNSNPRYSKRQQTFDEFTCESFCRDIYTNYINSLKGGKILLDLKKSNEFIKEQEETGELYKPEMDRSIFKNAINHIFHQIGAIFTGTGDMALDSYIESNNLENQDLRGNRDIFDIECSARLLANIRAYKYFGTLIDFSHGKNKNEIEHIDNVFHGVKNSKAIIPGYLEGKENAVEEHENCYYDSYSDASLNSSIKLMKILKGEEVGEGIPQELSEIIDSSELSFEDKVNQILSIENIEIKMKVFQFLAENLKQEEKSVDDMMDVFFKDQIEKYVAIDRSKFVKNHFKNVKSENSKKDNSLDTEKWKKTKIKTKRKHQYANEPLPLPHSQRGNVYSKTYKTSDFRPTTYPSY